MSSLKIMWLGYAIPDEIANSLFELDPLPAIQTHKFGWSFARSVKGAFGNIILASTFPVQNFPLVARVVFRGGNFKAKGMNGVMLGFINLLILKHITRFLSCLFVVPALIKRHRINWIFVHGIHTPYLIFSLLIRFTGCRVAIVLTDPPGVVLSTDSYLGKLLKRIDLLLVHYLLRRVDAVFAVSSELAKRLAPNRPSLVFPGILDSTLNLHLMSSNTLVQYPGDANTFTIIYAGGLSRSYGVDRLINAVLEFDPEISIRLKLYGRGDQAARIQELATKDPRFFYGGFVETSYLIPELCSANMLINPRPTEPMFAMNSFPSKLIEYLATGRPVLTTRISSIPDSLMQHFYFIDDESVKGIQSAISAVMKISESEIVKHGLNARQFVEVNYSETNIGLKIKNFINQLDV